MAIMNAEFISSVEVGLETLVVFVMLESFRRPDENLWYHFITCCLSGYVTGGN